ncbi:hypothetical protein J416_02419 [Gracilibacillus halophilus YIM-C55.5]|uniref:Uncharacterized protein n=1 Tax=Gracilibacillus halophilus YIM-C55.5 TaxID=1308866 RepID=N4WYG2_9BACI|nr:hypothetical protein J416_02419 [Gracilibacillus halophilus YIM-C55.5]
MDSGVFEKGSRSYLTYDFGSFLFGEKSEKASVMRSE